MGVRILHVISSLGPGGAERAMARLILRLRERGLGATVVSVGKNGVIGSQLAELNVPIHALNVAGPASAIQGIFRLRQIAALVKPHIIQGWMYHGNLFAGATGLSRVPVVFGVRHSLPTLAEERVLTRAVILVGGVLSRRAQAIVYNAKASIAQHERLGYASRHGVWIPNGFDTEIFRPDDSMRRSMRAELGIDAGAPVVGLVARFHAIKDQPTFLRAAAVVASHKPETRFVLSGSGIDDEKNGLRAMAVELGIGPNTILLGDRADVSAIFNALDVICLTSRSEGFPNVVAEAMACGVPVVATRVGDVEEIVGETGKLVDPGDAPSIARCVLEVLTRDADQRRSMSREARDRIVQRFSESAAVNAFESLYRGLALSSEAR